MSYDESNWDEETEEIQINFEDEQIKNEFQCRVCFKMVSEKIELMKHIEIHTEQLMLDFIKQYQPVSGNMILKKFKNVNLVNMEKKGSIKFIDEFMGWCLPEFIIKDKEMKESRFISIINAPCFTCQNESTCEISNEKINPLNCQLIDDWVNEKYVSEKDIVEKSEKHMENIMQAKFFCSKNKTFDIIGKFEKNKILNSTNKFTFTDKTDYKIPIMLKLEDEKKIELGRNMIIKNVKLTSKTHGMVIDACLKETKIQKI